MSEGRALPQEALSTANQIRSSKVYVAHDGYCRCVTVWECIGEWGHLEASDTAAEYMRARMAVSSVS